ncbi:hypothetical protein TcasGA2_TC003428 [Tribolium castaneum]|uniref:Uncharacterized protein n=1 Tax=Tribolium castaneum TaxID=7070 RepID=D6WGH4_TRICA|nr:hypothetical protein TcasGA2_TC003428 [Tribolium castaneum]
MLPVQVKLVPKSNAKPKDLTSPASLNRGQIYSTIDVSKRCRAAFVEIDLDYDLFFKLILLPNFVGCALIRRMRCGPDGFLDKRSARDLHFNWPCTSAPAGTDDDSRDTSYYCTRLKIALWCKCKNLDKCCLLFNSLFQEIFVCNLGSFVPEIPHMPPSEMMNASR